ncbi:MAG: oligosaccharide flippase family protein [Acidobacteriia bacterium]|nr:oligosaccharide flippase family protein [Terriglobia bacterium]
MNEQLAKLFRNAAVYGFGRILGKVISFLLIPFYTHYFSAGEYGVMEILNLTAMIATVLLAPGLSTAVMRFYYDTDDDKEKKLVVSTGMITTLLVGGAAVVVALLFPNAVSQALLGSAKYRTLVQLMAFGFFFTFSADIGWVYLRGKQRSGLYTFLTQGFLLLSVGLNIYFVAGLKLGIAGSFWANLAAAGAVWVVLMFLTLRETGLRISGTKLFKLLKFGAPLFTVWVAAFVLNFSDRFFLQRFHGIDTVGVYAVGYKFAYVLSLMAIQPFQLMWEPQSYEIAKREDAPALFSQVFTLYSVALITVAFLVSISIREVFEVMVGARFTDAYRFVPLLAFAYVVQGMGLFFEAGLLVRKKNVTLSIIGIASTVFCLALNFGLILRWGAWGAVWATFFSFAFLSVASYWFSVAAYPVRCNFKVILQVLGCCAALLAIAYLLPAESFIVRVAVKSVLATIFLFMLTRLRLLPPGLLRSLRADSAAWMRARLSSRRLSSETGRVASQAKGVN